MSMRCGAREIRSLLWLKNKTLLIFAHTLTVELTLDNLTLVNLFVYD